MKLATCLSRASPARSHRTLCTPPRSTRGDCDDGLFCDGIDICANGVCVPGVDPRAESVGCTIDTCDEANNACTNDPRNGLCDNGLFRDGAETCDPVNGCQDGRDPGDRSTATCDEVPDASGSIVLISAYNAFDGFVLHEGWLGETPNGARIGTTLIDFAERHPDFVAVFSGYYRFESGTTTACVTLDGDVLTEIDVRD